MGSKKNNQARMPRKPCIILEKHVPLSVREIQQINSQFGENNPDILNPLHDLQGVNYSPVWALIKGELSVRDLHARYAEHERARGLHSSSDTRPPLKEPGCDECAVLVTQRSARKELRFCIYRLDESAPPQRRWLCHSCRSRYKRLGVLMNTFTLP